MFNIKPSFFYKYNHYLLPIIGIIMAMLFGYGFYQAIFISPPDYQQGEAVRIMYIHVPCAWLALNIYFSIGVLGCVYLVWRNNLTIILSQSLAPIGALFALITLITGSLWGKPIWGTYWVWDARLTSMLILFIFYISLLLILYSSNFNQKSYKFYAIFSIMGAINVPIVKFSVEMWHSLHQPASIIRKGGIAIDNSMLVPLFTIFAACICYIILLVFMRMEILLFKQKQRRLHLYNVARER